MNQDISRSKHSPEIYFEGKNIRVVTNKAFGSVTNQKGNTLKTTIPVIPENPTLTKTHLDKLPYPLDNPRIVGSAHINNDLYFLSKYPVDNDFAKLYYAQVESGNIDNPGPFIDSNLRVSLDTGNGFETFFENFDSTGGAIEGPSLPTGTPVRIQAFSFSFAANEPAPDPHIYLEIYENGVLIETLSSPLNYIDTVTLTYTFTSQKNTVYYFHAYTLESPGSLPNPFTAINPLDYIVEADIFTIHKLDKDYNLSLEFIDIYNIGDKKVDVQGFYENQNNQKLYWANEVDPLSFINIADPNSLELNRKFLSTVPDVIMRQPEITGTLSGGSSHTSGSVQYAYNLYKKNGAQTKISPLSEIAYLNTGDRGNDVNQRVDKSIRIKIEDIDTTYDRIRLYSIKYNSQNSTPEIKVILERDLASTIEFIDDNNSLVSIISFSEFIFLGGEIYIPKHLIIKDNHLFMLNYKTESYDVDFDARAYRYDVDGEAIISSKDGLTTYTFDKNNIPDIPENFDCINPTNKAIESDPDWNKYIWKSDGTPDTNPLGGTGKNISFEIKYREQASNFGQGTMVSTPSLATVNKASQYTSLKSGEVYRLFIQFFTEKTGPVFSKWICDVKIPEIGTVGSKSFANTNYVAPPPPPLYKEIEVTNPPGYITSAEACDANVTVGNVKYIDRSFAITNGLIIYEEDTLTTRTFNSDAFSGRYGIIFDREANLKYAFTLDVNGDVDVIASCGFISDNPVVPEPDSPTDIFYCHIETELLNIPNDERITGWRTCIVERNEFDRSVITQGMFNPAVNDEFQNPERMFPSYFQRTMRNTADIYDAANGEIGKPLRYNTNVSAALNLSSNNNSASGKTLGEITAATGKYKIDLNNGMLYTPETILNKRNIAQGGVRLRRLGLLQNTFSYSKREVLDENGSKSTIAFSNRDFITTGSNLLMALEAVGANEQTKTGKFISDNKNVAGTTLFGKRKHSFVRYYGGITYPRSTFGVLNNIDATGKINYMAPIQNVYSFINPDNATSMSFGTGANIPVFYDNNTPTDVLFRTFGGSALAITGLPQNFVIDAADLPGGDPNDYSVLMEVYRVIENQYGGDTHVARQLNRTIPYSNVRPVIAGTKTTEHQGDTFIQKFNFLKTFRGDDGILQSNEIISFPVETYINLDLRWDIMKNRPDNLEADENTSYGFNNVYNQLNNTIKGITRPFDFEEIIEYPVNVIPSKLKIAGELIDSFTEFLVNDVKTLDGKYGEITAVGEHEDKVFAFQRDGISYLAINPRVQLGGSDGIQIELGSGRLIERYQYLTTSSGTLNKWSLVKTKNGLMYYDLLNKSINFIADQELSTVNGVFNKLLEFTEANKNTLEIDDILDNKGVHAFYDNNTEDTYFTFLADNNKFTVSYNGLVQGFVSYYDFHPTNYFKYRNRMLTTIDNRSVWKHNEGNYQTFYGVYYPASVTVLCNPEPYKNKIFNNIGFQAECYINSADQPAITFNKMRVWNEFQDTGVVDLVPTVRPSLKRKFRNWNSIIPRTQNSRDRINNAWAFVMLEFDRPASDYEIVLHDLIVSYL